MWRKAASCMQFGLASVSMKPQRVTDFGDAARAARVGRARGGNRCTNHHPLQPLIDKWPALRVAPTGQQHPRARRRLARLVGDLLRVVSRSRWDGGGHPSKRTGQSSTSPWGRLTTKVGRGPIGPAVAYTYALGRGAQHAEKLLAGYCGIVQCDGYAGYKQLGDGRRAGGPTTVAFCWAHWRRRFYEIASWKPFTSEIY
jgi:Transposase IS66 family